MAHSRKIDTTDCKILNLIQTKGRLTNVELAQHIGLSTASTLERVRKLENQQIIQGYRTQIDHSALGLRTTLILQIRLRSLTKANIKVFKEALDDIPEITACYQVVGRVDFWVKVIIANLEAYQQLLIDKLSEISVIEHIEPLLITDTLKDTGVNVTL